MNYTCADGKFIPSGQAMLPADNRSYRYGDGLFETMKIVGGKICLESFHFDRLFAGFKTLQFNIPPFLTKEKLTERIIRLCEKNECTELARVRVSASRGEGGLYDGNDTFHYLVETWPLTASVNQLNENGLVIGVYPDARKSCDPFSNLKSANFLPYVMAAKYAKANQWNDSLVLNQFDRIADSTISNVFMITGNTITTPPLGEGCVDGVMRRYLLYQLPEHGYSVEEKAISPPELEAAQEIFLSNIMGLRWVKQLNNKLYSNTKTREIYQLIKPLWE